MSAFVLPPAPETPFRTVFRHETDRVPEATVVVPLWNGSRFLPDLVASVAAQVNVEMELIITDDGSEDDGCARAADLVREARIRFARALVVSHDRRAGPAAARDTGMRLARSPAALLLDVDNTIYPRCLRRSLDALAATDAAFVYPILRIIGLRNALQGYQLFDPARLARGNYIDTLVLIRRAVWERIGGFPHLAEGWEDYALWLTLVERGLRGAQIPEVLAVYRAHPAGRTAAMPAHATAVDRRIRQAFPWIDAHRDRGSDMKEARRMPADLYIDLMIRILTNTIYQDPSMLPGQPRVHDPAMRDTGQDWPSQAHTMAGTARLRNLAELVGRTLSEGIPGDYIETGVWRGGCCILMRAVLAAQGEAGRKVYVADSFAGLPPPRPDLYPHDAGDLHHTRPELAVGLAEVKENFARYGLLDEQVIFVQGLFHETLPRLTGRSFALLRLDGDMYESTMVALEALYPALSPGGFVIIDDFNAVPGCRQAVEDFRTRNGIDAPLVPVDWTAVWWQKPHAQPAAIDPVPMAPSPRREEHEALDLAFRRRSVELGETPNPLFFWYHTIDLGQGLVTPGSFDYRDCIGRFGFPPDLTGKTVLDIGSATGYFAFEFERRGAEVVSTELPALVQWDRFPGEPATDIIETIRSRLAYHSISAGEQINATFRALSAEDLHHILLDGPFRFCHARLGSRVERVYGAIGDLGQILAGRTFDLVHMGDVLVHMINPLQGIAAAADLCCGELIIVDDICGGIEEEPVIRYVGGAKPGGDIAEWWRPNLAWYHQILTRLGFRTIEVREGFTTRIRPGGETLHKRVISARDRS
jgi:glycosyltransferase involved in cell wall biosynthesis/SAM-dependent methyltransferase